MTNYIQLFAINAQDISGTVTQGNAVMYNTLTTSTPTNNIRTGIRDKDFGSSVLMNSVLRQNSFAAYLLGEMFVEPNFITTAGTDFNTDTPSNATTDANNFSSFLLKIRNVVNSNINQHAHTAITTSNYVTSSGENININSQMQASVNKYIGSNGSPVYTAKYYTNNTGTINSKNSSLGTQITSIESKIRNAAVRKITITYNYPNIPGFYHNNGSVNLTLKQGSYLNITCVHNNYAVFVNITFRYEIGSGILWYNNDNYKRVRLCKLPANIPLPKSTVKYGLVSVIAGGLIGAELITQDVKYELEPSGYVYFTFTPSEVNNFRFRRMLSNGLRLNSDGTINDNFSTSDCNFCYTV